MTQQINIDKNETITISNNTFGDISITLNEVGEYVVVSSGPPVNLQQVTLNGGLKQEYKGDSESVTQTAFSNVKIKGDFIIGKVSQSIE